MDVIGSKTSRNVIVLTKALLFLIRRFFGLSIFSAETNNANNVTNVGACISIYPFLYTIGIELITTVISALLELREMFLKKSCRVSI